MGDLHDARAADPLALEDHLAGLCRTAGLAPPTGIGFRRTSPSPVDLRLFFRGADARSLAPHLAADPLVADARCKGKEVALRLADDAVERLIDALLAGRASGDDRPGPLAGQTHAVHFLNPNATKPLHLGHLRNLATGAALAASREAAGARVLRQAYVCDIGRNVCEAMAGCTTLPGGAEPQPGERADRWVGRCYAAYAAAVPEGGPGDPKDPGDPVSREAHVRGDLADEMVRGWLAEEPDVRALWDRLVTGALDGQRATLARLGIAMDRLALESESLPRVTAYLDHGLATGLLQRADDGSVHYHAGRSGYERLPLLRSDGLPTEHARVIGLFLQQYDRLAAQPLDAWVVVCGDEWDAAGAVELELASRLGAGELAEKVEVVTHGMVTLAGSKMKSRDGKALLIDDLLDRLGELPELRAMAGESAGRVSAEQASQMLVKGYFLSRKLPKALEFRWEDFAAPERNPAWFLARAWCRVNGGAERAPDATARDDEACRVALLQAFHLPPLVHAAADGFAGTELAKFAVGLAKWTLEQRSEPRLDAVVRAVLARTLGALGLLAAKS
ncbi:MAG: arginine--tRNA ligase [Planctomycetota bacterium]